MLVSGLQKFHNGLPGVDTSQYPDRYKSLIRQQNALGWDQLYRGRWSKEWSHLHSLYARSQAQWTTKQGDGDLWVVTHGKKLLEQWLLLWSQRNSERHGADMESRQQARHAILLTELEKLYTLRKDVTPNDRSVFYTSATQHVRARPDPNVLENWILTHRSAIMASATQAQRHGIHRNQPIDAFFQRRHNPLQDRVSLAEAREPP